MLMSQEKWEDNGHTLLGEILGSAILDNGASGTICGIKWSECFLEIIQEKLRQTIKV